MIVDLSFDTRELILEFTSIVPAGFTLRMEY